MDALGDAIICPVDPDRRGIFLRPAECGDWACVRKLDRSAESTEKVRFVVSVSDFERSGEAVWEVTIPVAVAPATERGVTLSARFVVAPVAAPSTDTLASAVDLPAATSTAATAAVAAAAGLLSPPAATTDAIRSLHGVSGEGVGSQRTTRTPFADFADNLATG